MESSIDAHRSGDLVGIMVFDSAYGSGNSRKPLPLEGSIVGKGRLTLPCATRYLARACGSRPDIGRAQELRAYYGLSGSQVEPGTRVLT